MGAPGVGVGRSVWPGEGLAVVVALGAEDGPDEAPEDGPADAVWPGGEVGPVGLVAPQAATSRAAASRGKGGRAGRVPARSARARITAAG